MFEIADINIIIQTCLEIIPIMILNIVEILHTEKFSS